jgi:hypothetical protein
VEDWQQWQIRADQIAASLGEDVDAVEKEYFSESEAPSYRGFWPRFRDLKERVRTAPAITLDAKLALERRLRDLGAKAYKGQEAAFQRSEGRKAELLATIEELRNTAEGAHSPRELRAIKRNLDALRGEFESGLPLMPADRQAVWTAWRDATEFVWTGLTALWNENEHHLRDILADGRRQLERGSPNGARQAVSRFFDALKGREARQSTIAALKNEASELRSEVSQAEERRQAVRTAGQPVSSSSPVEGWKAELERSKEAAGKVADELETLEQQFRETHSLLEQAMLRGTIVDKKRKLSELERAGRSLEQRIEQAEELPVIQAG